jgi:hypothetical protein
MYEHLRDDANQQPSTAEAHIKTAGKVALSRMIDAYGVGYPHYVSGNEFSFAAHNGLHGQEVGQSARIMATRLELPPLYVALSQAAGWAHDAILTDGNGNKLARGEMEDRTAAYFGGLLRAEGAEEAVIKAGILGVLATKVTFSSEGYLVAQGVVDLEFPTREAEEVAMSVSCADIAGAYGRRAPVNCLEYYKEFRGIPADVPAMFDPNALAEHYQNQQRFLDNYAFPHPVGERLFGTRRGELNEFYRHAEGALQAGTIDDWQTLFERSEAYARR